MLQKRPWKATTILFAMSASTSIKPVFYSITSSALSVISSYPPGRKIGVIGGGASGIFAAISAAETATASLASSSVSRRYDKSVPIQVVVLEATSSTLHKVKISGGGRCNVLHDTSKSVSTILAGYPRGQRELNGLYHKRFTPTMARDWFEHRGVKLKVEQDGRMFPITDSSQTIMDALLTSANQAGVQIRLRQKINHVERTNNGDGFSVVYRDESIEQFDRLILATGSSSAGYALAKSLGHDPLVSPVPSLFTFNCKHALSPDEGLLYGLSGVSVPSAIVTLQVPSTPILVGNNNCHNDPNKNTNQVSKRIRKGRRGSLTQEGPLLITHYGISGPAALRLSAVAARELRDMNYRGHLSINWDAPVLGQNAESLTEELWKFTILSPKRNVATGCPIPGNSIPRRLWSALVTSSGFSADTTWGCAPKKLVRQLATNLVAYPLEFTGKGTFKDEFVTAGGVNLKDIDMTTMESKICPGLYFCGEVIDVDGITGGYNFMNCWSTGYVAGEACSIGALKILRERGTTVVNEKGLDLECTRIL